MLDGDAAARARAAAWRAGFALLQGDPVSPAEIRSTLSGYADSRVTWFVAHALIDRSELALASALLDDALGGGDEWTAAAVLASRAKLAHAAGDLAALERDGNRSAGLFAGLGDLWGRLQATDWVGGLAELIGDYDRAAALHEEGLRWAEELELWPEVGSKLSWLAWIAVQTRDYPRARELADRAYRLAVEQGAPAAIVFAELSLGFAARRDRKLDVAVTHLQHLAELGRQENQPALYLPMVLVELGYAAEQGGDPAAGLALHLEAFQAAQAMGAPRDTITALEAWRRRPATRRSRPASWAPRPPPGRPPTSPPHLRSATTWTGSPPAWSLPSGVSASTRWSPRDTTWARGRPGPWSDRSALTRPPSAGSTR